jgi:hypothetical protein
MAGEMRIDGQKYIETPTVASVQIFANVNVDFTWKLDGDLFTQSGTIVRPDGKKVVLEALIFRRARRAPAFRNNPAVGTWNQTAGDYITRGGSKNQSFSVTSDARLLLITPTHFMRMDRRNGKFAGVHYGYYSLAGEAVTTTTLYSTFPFAKGDQHTLTQKVERDKLQTTSAGATAQGEAATYHDYFERAGAPKK